jgi:hypothetical protein
MNDPEGHYPIPRPASGDDPRFCYGLTYDVITVLTAHGYPPLSSGADLHHWQRALFAAIYQEKPR